MTMTATIHASGATGMNSLHAVTAGLRALVLVGENFRNNRAKQFRLGPSDIVALEYLYSSGPKLPRELSAWMGTTSGTMTALLDRVEKAGYLRRENNPEDRRSLLIHLTPAGEAAMQWLGEQFEIALHRTLPQLPTATATELSSALEILSNALDIGCEGIETTPLDIHPHQTSAR